MTVFMLTRTRTDRYAATTSTVDINEGYFLTQADAQSRADEMNRPGLDVIHNSEQVAAERRRRQVREYNALVESGTEMGPARPEPALKSTDFAEWLDGREPLYLLDDCYTVIQVNNAGI